MRWYEVAQQVIPSRRSLDFDKCELLVKSALESHTVSPFHIVLDLNFTNDPESVGSVFSKFYVKESKRFPVSAIYTETNGFDINPDRWYFDLFAYSSDGGPEDLDWLSDWQSEQYPETTLTGMEDLQEVYAEAELGSESTYLASLMVVLKFQKLIYLARPYMQTNNIPVYSTAHDYDFVAKC